MSTDSERYIFFHLRRLVDIISNDPNDEIHSRLLITTIAQGTTIEQNVVLSTAESSRPPFTRLKSARNANDDDNNNGVRFSEYLFFLVLLKF